MNTRHRSHTKEKHMRDNHVSSAAPADDTTRAARLLPAVTFGLRAAVLAGIVIVSSSALANAATASAAHTAPLTTITLASPLNAMHMDETTCCSIS